MSHILISGLPRSGTTFLMSVLHKAGLDIGFRAEYVDFVNRRNMGGLEFLRDVQYYKNISLDPLTIVKSLALPEVIKHPNEWTNNKLNILKKVKDISRIILCVRDLGEVIKSQEARRPGNLVENSMKCNQIKNLRGIKEHSKINNIPFTILKFPYFLEEGYFLNKMDWFSDKKVLKDSFFHYRDFNKVHYKS